MQLNKLKRGKFHVDYTPQKFEFWHKRLISCFILAVQPFRNRMESFSRKLPYLVLTVNSNCLQEILTYLSAKSEDLFDKFSPVFGNLPYGIDPNKCIRNEVKLCVFHSFRLLVLEITMVLNLYKEAFFVFCNLGPK